MTNNINIRRQTKPLVSITPSLDANFAIHAKPAEVIVNPWKSAISVAPVAKASAFVGDMEDHLINHIVTYGNNSIVVGCIAWLSNPRIIAALARHV